jgi:O-methyltransferase
MSDSREKQEQLLDKQLRAADKARRALDRLASAGVREHDLPGAALVDTVARLGAELNDLRSSYYFAGAHKKLDIGQMQPFADVATMIKGEARTKMDLDRLYTLWQAVTAAPDGPCVEVGSYKGGSAKFIAESMRRTGRSPRFFVCDTFAGHAQIDRTLDTVHRHADKFQDTSVEDVVQYLSGYDNVTVVPGDIHATAAALADVPAWGFVHVDVDVYPATDFCLRLFAPRLMAKAWLVVDDYGFTTCPGAKKAVDDFVREQPAYSLLHLLSGQAVIMRSQ